LKNDDLTNSTARPTWFWFSLAAVLFWGAWAMLSKVASQDIPAKPIQFLFTIGALPVVLVVRSKICYVSEKHPQNAIGILQTF
jgi:hypothetical protein